MDLTERAATVVETIAIDAPIAAVFAALTTPDELVRWWGSDDAYRVTAMERDLRPGGAWKTTGAGRDGTAFTVSGVYCLVDPPARVEFTWRYDWAPAGTPDTVVRHDLTERDGRTELTVTHSGFASVEERDDHARGWPVVLGWLRGYLTPAG